LLGRLFARRAAPWPQRFARHARRAPDGPLKTFYQGGSPGGDTPLADLPMVSLDLETTGLDPDKDSIVSVGMIDMTIDTIYCRGARHWLLRPERDLSAASVAIHEITHSAVRHSPALEARFDDVLAALAGKVVVVHFAPIERRFLDRASRRVFGYPLEFPIIDTMELERRQQRLALPRLPGNRESLRLDACRGRLKLPRYKAHHALTDALATAELLQAQVAHWHRRSDPASAFWM